jgi:GNAT superfamily N-acetyltransferase
VNSSLQWREEALTRQHDRAGFDCGRAELNEYVRRYARQNHQIGAAKTFVAIMESDPTVILGYYTISPGAIAFEKAPPQITKSLGRYEVPVFRLGRLAVSLAVQGKGLGGDLLLAAAARCLSVAQEVGGVALAIDAKDERAANWYIRFGALPLLDDPFRLVLPLDTVRAVL